MDNQKTDIKPYIIQSPWEGPFYKDLCKKHRYYFKGQGLTATPAKQIGTIGTCEVCDSLYRRTK